MHNIQHTESAKLKMRVAKLGKPHPHTSEWNTRIGDALRGKKRPKILMMCTYCGTEFIGVSSAKYCSKKCNKAKNGRNWLHRKELFSHKRECAICGSKNKLVGDHDHKTGKPRGILCMNCNLVIGNCMESRDVLLRAIVYLEQVCGK